MALWDWLGGDGKADPSPAEKRGVRDDIVWVGAVGLERAC